MNAITILPLANMGYGFVDPKFLPEGKGEYYIRDEQQIHDTSYRNLTEEEIRALTKNGNSADDWKNVLVTEQFTPDMITGCRFFGFVRIGDLEGACLAFNGMRLPIGLYNSTIVSCDIGSRVAIHNIGYISHYITGDEVILFNIDDLLTTGTATFGNGIVKDGESGEKRTWIALINENGGRAVLPFTGMLPADALLWGKYRDNARLMEKLKGMTDMRGDRRHGYYGTIGDRTVVKDCRIIKDTAIGSDAFIHGANRLDNLTILSDEKESTEIGEEVELKDGIVGYGCRVYWGVKALRFVMGTHTTLNYGVRFIDSVLGDNSTVSCCEVLNSLIFPGHEQHHNSSFLIASLMQGQSNIASGVTIGSNHNSRAPDGEIVAGRGFWPGLCVSLKHNCRFASYTLLAKGAYPYELDIPLPFALVANNESENTLQVMPAYWFLYNMYALARNSWKYAARDTRIHKEQHIEFDALAPDTVEEMFKALDLLEVWTAKAALHHDAVPLEGVSHEELRAKGRELLLTSSEHVESLEILGERLENSRRPVRILKTVGAYSCYREMIHYYAVKTLVEFIAAKAIHNLKELKTHLREPFRGTWINLGGQLVRREDVETLKDNIVSGEVNSWDAVHGEYERLWKHYPEKKARHALGSLLEINDSALDQLDAEKWFAFLDRAEAIRKRMADLTYESRAKDYIIIFRHLTYDTREEMDAVLGPLEKNAFVAQMREDAEQFSETLAQLKRRENV